jgi:hypothetical protein
LEHLRITKNEFGTWKWWICAPKQPF